MCVCRVGCVCELLADRSFVHGDICGSTLMIEERGDDVTAVFSSVEHLRVNSGRQMTLRGAVISLHRGVSLC
jgi:hypothetical protein